MEPTDRKSMYTKRMTALKLERNSWDSHWQEINNYIQPRTSRFLTSDRNQGAKANKNIIDCTAGFALRNFCSGMMAGVTSPARPWFRFTTYDPYMMEYKSVRVWLYDVEQRMRTVIARSNAYYTFPNCYRSLALYGTDAFLILSDPEEVFRCYSYPIGSYYISTSSRCVVDTIFREYSMTVLQLVKEFGKDNCSQHVKDSYDKGNYDVWVDVVHVICPNEDRDSTKATAKNKPFISCWYEKNSTGDEFLKESGFDDFPVMVPRWDVLGEDIYGHSIGMEILGDVKQLQLEQKRKIEAIEKLVNPPMAADSSLKASRLSLLPGDVNYVNGLSMSNYSGFRPVYEVQPRIQEFMMDIQEVQTRIKRAFYEDVMMMFATADSNVSAGITAREVEERHQEKLFALGPFMERLNNELLNKMLARVFNIMLSKGLIPPPPPELEGQDLKIEYISIMAQAQKLIGVNSLERLVGYVGGLAGVDPSVMDKFDIDQSVDEFGDMVGAPPRVIRSDDEVAEIRKQKQQAQQAQMLAAAAPAMQQGAQAAKQLSETNVTDVNALTRLMGAA